MKYIQGYNAAVTTLEDILPGGTGITLPTVARVHAITSASAEDDNTSQVQIETATAAGTVTTSGNATVTVTSAGMTGSGTPINVAVVAGTLQVETATVVGTIGAAGEGNAVVSITSSLLTEQFDLDVAVANNDNAATVAGKIRSALGAETTITDLYTVSGASASVILTAKTKADNDTTLNIAVANGTCSGLTADAASDNTTAGVAQDTAALIGGKIRAALVANANIGHPTTGKFAISGTGASIILTANVAAANDATLNVAIADGTSVGVTTAASSANTQNGSVASGAKSIRVDGVDSNYNRVRETVYLNGTTAVNTSVAYRFINSMTVLTGAVNTGIISATALTDSTVTCTIPASAGESIQGYYMTPNGLNYTMETLHVNAINATAGAITTVYVKVMERGGGWVTKRTLQLNSSQQSLEVYANVWMPDKALTKISATVSGGSSEVYAYATLK